MNTTFTKRSAQGMISNFKTIILLLLVPLAVIGCTEDCNPLNPNIDVNECRRSDNIFATLRDERAISAAHAANATRLQEEVNSLNSHLNTSRAEAVNLTADLTASQTEVSSLQGMVDTLTSANTRLEGIERRWNALTGQSNVNVTHQLFVVNRTQGGTQANWTLPLINTTIHFQDPAGNNYTLEWQDISTEN